MILLGGFGRSARTRGWAVLDGLRSKELRTIRYFGLLSGFTVDFTLLQEFSY